MRSLHFELEKTAKVIKLNIPPATQDKFGMDNTSESFATRVPVTFCQLLGLSLLISKNTIGVLEEE